MTSNRHALLTQHLRAQALASDPETPEPIRQQAQKALDKSWALLNLQKPEAQPQQQANPEQQEAQAQQQAQVQAQQSAPVL